MATGIVSIAASVLGIPVVPEALFALNLVFYPVLWGATIARALRYRGELVADLSHHGRAVGFFTMVAATCVLGSEFVVVAHAPHIAFWFWVAGIVLDVILVYSIFAILTVKEVKPPLSEGLNGGWLVAVVAAQSIAVLGAQIAQTTERPEGVLFFSLVMWLGGGMLYFWIISLIFYRYTFFTMAPSDLAPPYWINMGAAAISTLAGSMLVGAREHSQVLMSVLPFVRGLSLVWWATATWWIPMLIVLGVWRHVLRKFPVRYDPLYWGAVFPLGMYTVATARLAQAVDAPYLFEIPRWTVFVALGAWMLAFVGMVAQLSRTITARTSGKRAQ
ncbi:MAG: C4-dicarboxylate ABC transporter [Polyangiaceae bacterium]|nr:C4-dicarboxylate ABC transporter [Polyangiaceae bacterium]